MPGMSMPTSAQRPHAVLRPLLPLLGLALALTACGTSDRKIESTSAGVIAGCATGMVVAFVIKGNPMRACLGGAVAGGALGYEKARREELAQARREAETLKQQNAAAASAPVVQTQAVQVVDAESGRVQEVEAFRGMTVDLPLSQVDTPEGREVLRKLDLYARKLAQDRAEPIQLDVAKAGETRQVLDEAAEEVGKGWVIRRSLVDTEVPQAVQRVSIEARNPVSFLASL